MSRVPPHILHFKTAIFFYLEIADQVAFIMIIDVVSQPCPALKAELPALRNFRTAVRTPVSQWLPAFHAEFTLRCFLSARRTYHFILGELFDLCSAFQAELSIIRKRFPAFWTLNHGS